ncbi:MAG: Ig-like domain-containing protein [Bacteroidales bacterium]|nr:Ig-like domain-containing protein [Bacteroidales bacterium]
MFFIACKGGSGDGDDESEKENPSGETTVTVTAVEISGPEVNEVEIGATLTLTATVSTDDGSSYTGSVTWASSDDAIATVSGGMVTGVSEGETNITATAGGVTSDPYSVNVVPATPVYDYNAEESFIVPMTADGATADSTTYAAGATITDNTLFTLTTEKEMVYSVGSSYGNVKNASFKDMNGTTVNPDQGLKISTVIEKATTENPVVETGTVLTVTAKEDVTLYLYVQYTADGYSGNRVAKILYCVDGGESVTADASVDSSNKIQRNTITTITVSLEKGQVLTVGAQNLDTDNSGNFWLFGAEAKAKEGGNTGSTGSGSGGSSGGVEFEEDPNYEWVDTYADLETALAMAGGSGSNYKTTADLKVGKFTLGTGVYFENSNSNFSNYGVYDVNNQQKNIYFTVSGTYNNISFRAVESSGSQGTITLYTESGTALYTWTVGQGATVTVDYAADTGSYLSEGTYYIGSVNSFRMGQLCVSEYLEKSAVTGITVKATATDFLKGRSVTGVDIGISATLDYENGRQDTINLSDLVIDIPTTLSVGANTVTVTYNYTEKDGDGTSTPYTENVTIYVYYVKSITVSTMSMELTGGTYYTNNLQQVFLVGDVFNSDYLVVTATCSCDVTGMDDVEFILTESEYTITVPELTTKGEKTVTVSCDLGQTEGDSKTDSYKIHVVELTSSVDRAKVQVYNASDTTNTASYEADEVTGIISVATINDAIMLIKLMGATDAERKYI